jgi:acetyl esterase/lipase
MSPWDAATLQEVRDFNRKLDRLPRFGMRYRPLARPLQLLMRLSQVGADRRLARAGIHAEERRVALDEVQVQVRVRVRILRPAAGPVRAVVLDIHGGGWVLGNARMNDKLNAAIIEACDVAVVSVDYRLALDTPLQGLMDDCLAAARWLLDGGLPEYAGLPVFVVGESAGAHLAAATLLRLQAWPALLRRIAGAVLYYGVYDFGGTPSVRQAGPDTLLLDGPGILPSLRALTPGLSDAERCHPPLSPLYGDLAGMPPAILFACELDALRDDTITMAARWRAAIGDNGVERDPVDRDPVELHLLPEAPHGIIHFPLRMAQLVTARSHAWIRARIAAAQDAALTY